MSDVRCLSRPDRITIAAGNGAPTGVSKPANAARQNIADFLDASLMRPLYFNDGQMQERIDTAMTTMTQAERVFLELEMQSRSRVMHSFDYDPMKVA